MRRCKTGRGKGRNLPRGPCRNFLLPQRKEENLKTGDDDFRDYYYDEDSYDITSLWYDSDEKKVCSFPVDLSYRFYRDKLFLITYHVEYIGYDLQVLETNTYLKNAMTAKYGEGHEATREEVERIKDVMNVADSYYYEDEIRRITVWDLPEGTTAAFLESYYYADAKLIYFHFDTMLNGLPADGVYNTNGL